MNAKIKIALDYVYLITSYVLGVVSGTAAAYSWVLAACSTDRYDKVYWELAILGFGLFSFIMLWASILADDKLENDKVKKS